MHSINKSPASSKSTRAAGVFALLFLLLFSIGCSSTRPARTPRLVTTGPASEIGTASYYASKYHGRKTASGEVFNMRQLTAAHRSHSFGTRVKVTHLGNHRSVIVRINDRGPFVKNRIIDLSLAAARELEMIQSGSAKVKVEVVDTRRASGP